MSKIKINTPDLYQDSVTGDLYQLNPDGTFVQKSASGPDRVRTAANDVAFPQQTIFTDGVTNSAAGTTDVLTTADVSAYSHAIIKLTLTTDTMAVTGYLDSAKTIETAALLLQKTDGTYVAATALASGTYYLPNLSVYSLHFVKTGTTNVCSISLTMKS